MSPICRVAGLSFGLIAGFGLLAGACTAPAGDMQLSEAIGNYGPVATSANLTLTAVFGANIIDTGTRNNNGGEIYTNVVGSNVSVSLLSTLNPLLGDTWSTAAINVGNQNAQLVQNPGTPGAVTYSFELSSITQADSSPVTHYTTVSQLGQTVSDSVSTGCELLSSQILQLDFYADHFDASIVNRSVFNNISPKDGGTVVSCGDLFAKIQSDIRAGQVSAQEQLFEIFVVNDVISVDQISSLVELDVSAGLTAPKLASTPAPSGTPSAGSAAPGTGSTVQNAAANASLSAQHQAILKALSR